MLTGSGTSGNFNESSVTASDTEIAYTPPSAMTTSNVARVIYSYKIGQEKFQFFFE